MTKTESTIKNYQIEVVRLIKRFERDTGYKYVDDTKKIIPWLISKKPTWKAPTWRQYKAAFCDHFESTDQLEAKIELLSINCEGCKPNKTVTHSSSKKTKHLSIDDEELLSRYFIERKSNQWAAKTYCFMRATVLTDLRPGEWENAKLIKHHHNEIDIDILVVNNAKNTNGRANGTIRHIILINFTNAAMKIIRQNIWGQNTDYANIRNNCVLTPLFEN